MSFLLGKPRNRPTGTAGQRPMAHGRGGSRPRSSFLQSKQPGRGFGGGGQVQQLLQRRSVLQQRQVKETSQQPQQQAEAQTKQDLQGVISMDEVLEDLRVLEQQQRESQRPLEDVMALKQLKLDQRAALESKLSSLKYANGRQRAQLEHERDVLSHGTRELSSLKLWSQKSADSLKNFDASLKRALLSARSRLVLRRKMDSAMLLVENELSVIARKHTQVKEGLHESKQRRDALVQKKEFLVTSIQEEQSKPTSVSQETTSICKDITDLEKELGTAQQLTASMKLRAKSIAAEIDSKGKRHAASMQAMETRLQAICKSMQDKHAKDKATKEAIQVKTTQQLEAWNKCVEYQRQEGHHRSSKRDGNGDKMPPSWALIPLRNGKRLGSNVFVPLDEKSAVGRCELLKSMWKACGCLHGTCSLCNKEKQWACTYVSRQLLRITSSNLEIKGRNSHFQVKVNGKRAFSSSKSDGWSSGRVAVRQGMLLELVDLHAECKLEFRIISGPALVLNVDAFKQASEAEKDAVRAQVTVRDGLKESIAHLVEQVAEMESKDASKRKEAAAILEKAQAALQVQQECKSANDTFLSELEQERNAVADLRRSAAELKESKAQEKQRLVDKIAKQTKAIDSRKIELDDLKASLTRANASIEKLASVSKQTKEENAAKLKQAKDEADQVRSTFEQVRAKVESLENSSDSEFSKGWNVLSQGQAIMLEEEMDKIEQLLEEYPGMAKLDISYNPDKTANEQTDEILATIRADCDARKKRARADFEFIKCKVDQHQEATVTREESAFDTVIANASASDVQAPPQEPAAVATATLDGSANDLKAREGLAANADSASETLVSSRPALGRNKTNNNVCVRCSNQGGFCKIHVDQKQRGIMDFFHPRSSQNPSGKKRKQTSDIPKEYMFDYKDSDDEEEVLVEPAVKKKRRHSVILDSEDEDHCQSELHDSDDNDDSGAATNRPSRKRLSQRHIVTSDDECETGKKCRISNDNEEFGGDGDDETPVESDDHTSPLAKGMTADSLVEKARNLEWNLGDLGTAQGMLKAAEDILLLCREGGVNIPAFMPLGEINVSLTTENMSAGHLMEDLIAEFGFLGQDSEESDNSVCVNEQIVDAFDEIMKLYGELGKQQKVADYASIIRAIRTITCDITLEYAEDHLTDIPGIGAASAEKIIQFLKTGSIDRLEELREKRKSMHSVN